MVSLWLRIGDSGNYEAYGDDLDAAVGAMKDMGVDAVVNWLQFGFETDRYQYGNHISLFWGDRKGDFVRPLDQHNRKLVEKLLLEPETE